MSVVTRAAFAFLFTTGCGPSHHDIDAIIERGQPLIQAIQAYERATGHPPDSLDELAPRYIKEVPTTGLESSPQFQYRARSKSPGDWRLNVKVENLGFRHMRFDPKRTYEMTVTPLRDGWVMIDP